MDKINKLDKLARSDWKRHSAPYDFSFDYTLCKTPVGEVFDQAMEAFTEADPRKSVTMERDRKKAQTVTMTSYAIDRNELSTDQYTPGVLKVFGETVVPGAQYKSVLASCRSSAQELVKQALERFGVPVSEHQQFVLCDVVGRYERGSGCNTDTTTLDYPRSDRWEALYARILSDRDKPLLLQKFWKPIEGFSRRYELHERARVVDTADDDDTSGLNKNARKILISKLRPGAIPFFNSSCLGEELAEELSMDCDDGVNVGYGSDASAPEDQVPTMIPEAVVNGHSAPPSAIDVSIPHKHPFFLNVRGFDVRKDKLAYVIKSKIFSFVNGNSRVKNSTDDTPKFNLFAPDIEPVHCRFKVYKFRRANGSNHPDRDRNNYFLEVDPLVANVSVNGHRLEGKGIIKSGDILSVGLYYVFLFKDCSRGHDVPLVLPWFPVSEPPRNSDSECSSDNCELKLRLRKTGDEESKSNTDDSVDMSIADRMAFAYVKDKEEDLVKYICAIVQQQNTDRVYPLTVAFMFSMCIEYASKRFERRQFKHLFLRILFTVRDSVAETAKSLSATKFTCTLFDGSMSSTERDQRLERLLLWISNCVQILLFLKHTFVLPEQPISDPSATVRGRAEKTSGRAESIDRGRDDKTSGRARSASRGRTERTSGKDDNAKHALGQLVTGLEEIIMFCFQQCVYTLTKALHPTLTSILDSNPFSDANSEQSAVQDIVRMLDSLAEVTHAVQLHESITRQLFTYLFFFANTNVFNMLVVEDSGTTYYNWQNGVRVRANLSQLEEWATRQGLEDEFGQMFERVLAVSELLATSRNTLVKYHWPMMKTHYQPLTAGQLYHILSHYQHCGKAPPSIWFPTPEELEAVQAEELTPLTLTNPPPFALPDNCGVIDLVRAPEDTTFWSHLRRLKSLYGVAEDDSDSGFSISNTPRASSAMESSADLTDPFYDHENTETPTSTAENGDVTNDVTHEPLNAAKNLKSRLPVAKSMTNPWSMKMPRAVNGLCKCSNGSKTDRSLAADMMREEKREQNGCDHRPANTEDSLIASLHSKSIKLNVCSMPRNTHCKSENKEKLSVYLKKRPLDGVANCSARTMPRLHEKRERSNSEVGKPSKRGPSVVQSGSSDDIVRLTRKPSVNASFIEAIEHGRATEPRPSSLGTNSDNVFFQDQSFSSQSQGKSVSTQSSLSSDGLWGDEVFVDDKRTETTSTPNCDINSNTLPTLKSFKPNLTSSEKPGNKSRSQTHNQKLMAVSFDSGTIRRSSIELTKDSLFVIGVDEPEVPEEDETLTCDVGDTKELFPTEVFTEVSASTLASRKRFGSSLNVAPSAENSPRNSFHMSEPEPVRTKSAMTPSPLFTVYIQKHEGGLGIGLIDGLHTPLRLAGIYIRRILPDSPAAATGCLQVGDRLLAVDGKNVIGADYQSTLTAIKDAGETLTLLIARGNESMARKVSQT